MTSLTPDRILLTPLLLLLDLSIATVYYSDVICQSQLIDSDSIGQSVIQNINVTEDALGTI